MGAGAVQADWFTDLTVDDSDPFAVEGKGLPVDVSGDVAHLQREIVRLIEKEGRLAERGVTCAIKDREDTSCWACPVFRGRTSDSIAPLCNLGREQERLVTRLAVEDLKGREDAGS